MPSPIPKPPEQRQRRNATPRVSGRGAAGVRPGSGRRRTPELPRRKRGWHPMVRAWWRGVWRSPVSALYLDSDVTGGLYSLADLYQVRWEVRDDPVKLPAILKAIRDEEKRWGLSMRDRKMAYIELEEPQPKAKPEPRAKSKNRKRSTSASADPRTALKVVA